MGMNRSSRGHQRTLFVWSAIAISAALAFVLGVWGYWQYYDAKPATSSEPSFIDVLYYTLQLFVLEFEVSSGEHLPWPLEIARWLAPLSLSAAAIKTILNFAREQVQFLRCRLHRNHAVVCGLGRQGVQLVADLAKQDVAVIVIELDVDNPRIGTVESMGVPVLLGNATDAAKLAAAATSHARYVFAVTGNDKRNIEIAAKAERLRGEGGFGSSQQRCAVHIDNADLPPLLAEWPLFKTSSKSFDAHLFNINRLAARVVLDRFPPDRFQRVHGSNDPPASIAIFGTERLAKELIDQLARVGHYGNKRKPIVRLFCTADDVIAVAFRKRGALISEFVDLEIHDAGDFDFLLGDDAVLGEFATRGEPSVVFVCLSDDVDSLRLVAGLQRTGVTRRANVVVCIPHSTDIVHDAPSPAEADEFGFAVFDVMRETCTLDNVIREGLDRLARAIHRDYLVKQTEEGETPDTNSSLVSWDQLPEMFKEANRSQADHLVVKLRVLGYDSQSWPPPEALVLTNAQTDLLAELEHRRWLAERRLAGWRYASESKDAVRRMAPTIVSWEELGEREKEKDRDAARRLHRLVELKTTLESE